MYNDLFSIGPVTFHTYGLMTAIGIIGAYLLAERRAKAYGLDKKIQDNILGLVLACLVFGYMGSKLLYILTILPQVLADPSVLKDAITDGWVVFGGLLGGIFGGWLYCRFKKQDGWVIFDIIAPCMSLAQGFGRIGCFFAGCCYGVETDSPISIVFKNSQYAPNHVHLVPTQLISSLFNFALCLLLIVIERNWKKRRQGDLTALYLIFYSGGRFILEFWRGDLIRGKVGVLSTSQFIALFTLAAGLIILAYLHAKKPAVGSLSAAAAPEEEITIEEEE